MSVDERATILIVGDDPGVATLERRYLERAGHAVVSVADTAAAEAVLGGGGVDLLVLDDNLAGDRTGLEFYRDLQAAGHALPVIMVTGRSDEATIVAALRAGVRDFVTRSPASLDYLPEAVGRALTQVRTARALAASEAQFRRIVATAQEGVVVRDAASRISYANERMAAMLGHPVEALLGRPLTDFMDEAMRAEAERGFRERAAGRTGQFEFRFRRKDGTDRWVIVATMPPWPEALPGTTLSALANLPSLGS